jgi:hypothetical protein
MDKELIHKIFEAVYTKIGIGAIFLILMIFLWLKMEERQQQHSDMLMTEIKDSHIRQERLQNRFDESMKMHMEAINNCCRDNRKGN